MASLAEKLEQHEEQARQQAEHMGHKIEQQERRIEQMGRKIEQQEHEIKRLEQKNKQHKDATVKCFNHGCSASYLLQAQESSIEASPDEGSVVQDQQPSMDLPKAVC
jgi:predicted RNase H-like nuclease (RuvC/YqgF family)